MAKLSRRAIATYVAEQLTSQADSKKVILQLAAFLVDTRRTKELSLIVRDIQFYLSETGSVSGTITTATTLTAETKKAIERYIKEQTGAKTVALDSLIDPSVIGGVKVSIPGRELDATVSRSLTVLKTRFKKA
ncbi:MAG: atpH [Candidatus Saccharibacteria bacterium]|jgi:F0F1-type ATP synthase delta subunit|nr:atpH [Candidatus Saccharibacteria bacterium]MDB5180628.1 atpH [Candidatus Saccharibacteria bacterium]